MTKQDLELCKDIIKCMDKANFNLPAPEMVQISLKIMNFGRMIATMEAELNKPIMTPSPVEIINAPKKPRIRKENPIKVE